MIYLFSTWLHISLALQLSILFNCIQYVHSLKRQILVNPSNKKSQVPCPAPSLPHQFLLSLSCIKLSSVLNNMLIVFIYRTFFLVLRFFFFFCRINTKRRGFNSQGLHFYDFLALSLGLLLLFLLFFYWELSLIEHRSSWVHLLIFFTFYNLFFITFDFFP